MSGRKHFFLAFLVIFLGSEAPASASGYWLRYALPGAEVRSIAVDGRIGVFYGGTAHGSIYRSTDGGETWRLRKGGAPFPGYAVTALVPDPVTPGVLWAGLTGIVKGGLLVRSDDGGETFQQIRRWEDRPGAKAVAVTVVNGKRVIAVAGGPLIEISTDQGASWKVTGPQLSRGATLSFLAFHPLEPGILLTGSSRHPFRSADLGRSWQRIAGGMVEDTEVFSIDFSSSDPLDMWASTCGWVYRSTDGARSWIRFREGLIDRRAHVVRRDPASPARVLVGTTGGLFETRNLGKNFDLLVPDIVVNGILFDPKNPAIVILATEAEGILRSTDGGITFRPASSGISEARVSAVTRTQSGRTVLARAADGKSGGLWELDTRSGEATRLANHPVSTVLSLTSLEEQLFAGTPDGLFSAQTADAPFRRVLSPAVRGLLSTRDGLIVAATVNGVYSSRDRGSRWERMGTVTIPVESIQEVFLPEINKISLTAEIQGLPYFWDGKDWTLRRGLPRPDPSRLQKLQGGFGRTPVTLVRPKALMLGLSIDPENGFLVFRKDSRPEEAVFLVPPESGLTISGWTGDPHSNDGLLLATIGRGVFRYVSKEALPAVRTN